MQSLIVPAAPEPGPSGPASHGRCLSFARLGEPDAALGASRDGGWRGGEGFPRRSRWQGEEKEEEEEMPKREWLQSQLLPGKPRVSCRCLPAVPGAAPSARATPSAHGQCHHRYHISTTIIINTVMTMLWAAQAEGKPRSAGAAALPRFPLRGVAAPGSAPPARAAEPRASPRGGPRPRGQAGIQPRPQQRHPAGRLPSAPPCPGLLICP